MVVDGTDHFIKPIEAELQRRHQIERFTPRFVRLPLIGQRVNDWLLNRQLVQFMQRHDVVFFEWAGHLSVLASRLSGRAKRIVRAHRTEMFDPIEAVNWMSVDQVIFVSNAMRSRFLRVSPETEPRTAVVHNGVNLGYFAAAPTPFNWRMGMLGNLTPRKRVYDVVCALADLPKHIPWSLSVGGTPLDDHLDYWEALQGLISRPEYQQKVCLLNRVSNPSAWFTNIDIFISASYSEGQQMALIEAMACGCYCLSHCWDGVEEMLPADHIFTTDSDLRSKLLVYAAQDEIEKVQAQAHMRAIAEEKFDERRMVEQIVTMIEEIARS